MSPTLAGSISTVLIVAAVALFTTAVLDRQEKLKQEEVTPFRRHKRPVESHIKENISIILMVSALIVLFLP